MNSFFFVFDVVPTDACPQVHEVGGAKVHVFAVASDVARAEITAASHLVDYGWRITATERAWQPTQEQLAALDEPEASLHRKAKRQGVAALFYTWPKVDRDENDPIEIRSMGSPVLDPEPRH